MAAINAGKGAAGGPAAGAGSAAAGGGRTSTDFANIKAHGTELSDHGNDHADHGDLAAKAFAGGDDARFAGAGPDKRTAAHEAAHVVQQRTGRAR